MRKSLLYRGLYVVAILLSIVKAQVANQPGSGNALDFVGSGMVSGEPGGVYSLVANNFTQEFWVKPRKTRVATSESQTGISGTSGQNYAIYPMHGGCGPCNCVPTDAGAGVSVGTNGISVFEHAGCHMPALLVWNGTISNTEWTHVAVVFSNRTPSLYVNGVLVRTGLQSIKTVHPSWLLGDNGSYGPFNGQIDEVRTWNYALSAAEIRQNMCRKLPANYGNGLIGYWRLDEGNNPTVFDDSGNNKNGTKTGGCWIASGAPIGDASITAYPVPASLTLTHPSGENLTVTNVTGSPDGMHIYYVNAQPIIYSGACASGSMINTTTVGTSGMNRYFGVFTANGTSPTYTATYDYSGNPFINPFNESYLMLTARTHNAINSWSNLSATHNIVLNTLQKNNENKRGEYLLDYTAPLPIEWILLQAESKSHFTQLQWIIKNDPSIEFFRIYKSTNLNEWENITLIPANHAQEIFETYTFNDYEFSAGHPYYYIEAIDWNGKTQNSSIFTLKSSLHSTACIVYPNPSSQDIHFLSSSDGKFYLINAIGITISEISLKENEITTIQNLDSGIYFLFDDKNNLLSKIVINN